MNKAPRISIDAINGPADQGPQGGPDQFPELDNPISSTDHGLSNYEQNYPDGTHPVSGPQDEAAPRRPHGTAAEQTDAGV